MIPDSDRRKVYNHLAKHYKQFDKPVPDFKSVETQEMKELFDMEAEAAYEKARRDTVKDIKSIRQGIKDYRKQQKRADEKKDKAQHNLANQIIKALGKKLDDKLGDHRSINNTKERS